MLFASVHEGAGDRRARQERESRSRSRRFRGVKQAFIVERARRPGRVRSGWRGRPSSGVAIVATTTWAAFQAKKRSRSSGTRATRRRTAGSGAVTDAKKIATQPAAQMLGEAGDVDAAFKAGKTVEGMYTYPLRVARGPRAAELHGLVQGRQHRDLGADADAAGGRRRGRGAARVAEGQGHAAPAARRRRLRPPAGERQRLRGAAVSKQAGGVPVKVQWMREDDMAFDYYRAGRLPLVQGGGRQAAASSPAWQNHFITFSTRRQERR